MNLFRKQLKKGVIIPQNYALGCSAAKVPTAGKPNDSGVVSQWYLTVRITSFNPDPEIFRAKLKDGAIIDKSVKKLAFDGALIKESIAITYSFNSEEGAKEAYEALTKLEKDEYLFISYPTAMSVIESEWVDGDGNVKTSLKLVTAETEEDAELEVE